MSRTMTDLRGYSVREPEQASSKSKLLAATAVILGVAAIGAYAYTSHSLLPSKPQQPAAISQSVIPMTPPAQPAASTPDTSTPAPQATPAPEVQAPAPEIKAAPAPRASLTPKASEHVAHIRARVPDTKSDSTQTVTPPDNAAISVPAPQTLTPNVAAPAPATTAPTTPDTTQQPQTTDQTEPQTPPPQ